MSGALAHFRALPEQLRADRVFRLVVLVGIYGGFLFALALYLRGVITCSGVESWPSVPTEIAGYGGGVLHSTYQGTLGARTSTVNTGYVEFQYRVGETSYTARGPDPTLSREFLPDLRAYYRPDRPEVAVLNPVPHQADGLLTVVAFLGLLAAAHLWITLAIQARDD